MSDIVSNSSTQDLANFPKLTLYLQPPSWHRRFYMPMVTAVVTVPHPSQLCVQCPVSSSWRVWQLVLTAVDIITPHQMAHINSEWKWKLYSLTMSMIVITIYISIKETVFFILRSPVNSDIQGVENWKPVHKDVWPDTIHSLLSTQDMHPFIRVILWEISLSLSTTHPMSPSRYILFILTGNFVEGSIFPQSCVVSVL